MKDELFFAWFQWVRDGDKNYNLLAGKTQYYLDEFNWYIDGYNYGNLKKYFKENLI